MESLHEAAAQDNIETVKYYIFEDANINDMTNALTTRNETQTIDEKLHLAARHDRPHIIDEIYKSGLLTANAGETALRYAAEYGAVKVVAALLKYHINPNAYAHHKALTHSIEPEHKTPLGIAAEYGQYEVAKLLLENGAKVDQFTHTSIYQKDCTPLRKALIHIDELNRTSNPKLIALLLEHKTDVNKINTIGLSMLASDGCAEEIELLLKAGLDPNGKPNGTSHLSNAMSSTRDPSIPLLFIDHGANIHEVDKIGRTYLHTTENIALLKKFIAKGLDVNANDNHGKTPLEHTTNKEKAELLVENGANFLVLDPLSNLVQSSNLLKDKFNEKGISTTRYTPPIFFDLLNLPSHILITKIKKLTHLNDTDYKGRSILHLAGKQNLPRIVFELLKQKANVNLQDKKGNTPLHYAASNGNIEVVRVLLNFRANPCIENKIDENSLSLAKTRLIYDEISDAIRSKSYANPKKRAMIHSTLTILKRTNISQNPQIMEIDDRYETTQSDAASQYFYGAGSMTRQSTYSPDIKESYDNDAISTANRSGITRGS